jgi:ABC-type dipeptide/oligopeptide/nickel transport system permease subunit
LAIALATTLGALVHECHVRYWMAWWPGLAIVVTVLACTVVGDGLHDALDPKQY